MFESTSVRAMLTLTIALLLTSLLGSGEARAQETVSVSTPYGLAGLLTPASRRPGRYPVVLVLPDLLGRDGREQPYVDLLLEAGIAVLVVGGADADELASSPDPALLRSFVRGVAPGELDDGRIGLLGFGGGGRAALATPASVPSAVLYPSCVGLAPLSRDAATLVLHPDDPAETSACQRVSHHAEAVVGATHGWDHGHGPWAGMASMMPHPDGSGRRILARSNPRATRLAADRVLRFFDEAFELQAQGVASSGAPRTR